jgi:hypothetical protein
MSFGTDSTASGEQKQEDAAPLDAPVEQSQSEQAQEGQQNVPLTALQSEREQRQTRDRENEQLREELKMIKDHLSLMESTRSRESQPPPKDDFEGMEDGDVLTLGDFKKLLSTRERQYQTSIEELRMSQKHPDYQEVLQRYLPEILKTNPSLRRSLETNPDYELAYYLAKNSDAYKSANKKQKKHEDAERIVQNSQQAGSLSSLGATSPISQAKRYKDMSDDEFRSMVNKNLGVV